MLVQWKMSGFVIIRISIGLVQESGVGSLGENSRKDLRDSFLFVCFCLGGNVFMLQGEALRP